MDHTQNYRMTRPNRYTMDQYFTKRLDNFSREVLRACRRTCIQQDQVVRLRSLPHLLCDGIEVVWEHRKTVRLPPPCLYLGRKDQRIELDDITGFHRLPDRHQFSPGRQDRYLWAASDCDTSCPLAAIAPRSTGRRT